MWGQSVVFDVNLMIQKLRSGIGTNEKIEFCFQFREIFVPGFAKKFVRVGGFLGAKTMDWRVFICLASLPNTRLRIKMPLFHLSASIFIGPIQNSNTKSSHLVLIK
jgi:hypothetical protein